MVANSAILVNTNNEHLRYISENLQKFDEIEAIDAMTSDSIYSHLKDMVEKCDYNKVVISKGQICAMFGYQTLDFSPIGGKVGSLYALTTKNLANNKFAYLKVAKSFISEALKKNDCAFFSVLWDYKSSIKALEILGFKPVRAFKEKKNGHLYVEMFIFKEMFDGEFNK